MIIKSQIKKAQKFGFKGVEIVSLSTNFNPDSTMKKLFICMALLLSFIAWPQFMADTIVAQTPAVNRTRVSPRNNPGRPKAPSRNDYIEITAGPGFVECSFPVHIEGVYLVIGDESAPVAAGFVSVYEPRMEIPEIHGQYLVTCTTDEGDEYIGSLWFY